MEAQLQIRQNVQEAQEYLHDLLAWQQGIKSKSSKQATTQPAAAVPGVRGRKDSAVEAPPPELQEPALDSNQTQSSTTHLSLNAPSSHPAAHTYKNYKKWDQFDVDAALQSCENRSAKPDQTQQQTSVPPPRPQPASSKPSAADSVHPLDRTPNAPVEPSTATGWKDRGNQLFQAGHYDEALKCYAKSSAVEPNCLAYANAAMAHLKLNNHAKAEQACSKALELDPTYLKAYQRRGTARKALGKLLEAAQDFEAALRLEPSSQALRLDRDTCLQQHLQQQSLTGISHPQQQLNVTCKAAEVTPAAAAAAALQGLTPDTTRSSRPAQAPPGAIPPPDTPRPITPPHPAAPSPLAVPTTTTTSISSSKGSPASPSGSKTTQPGTAPPAAAAAVAGAAPASASIPQQVSPSGLPKGSPRVSPRQAAAAEQKTRLAAAAAAEKLAVRVLSHLKCPRTSVEFEAAWRTLKGDKGLQVRGLGGG